MVKTFGMQSKISYLFSTLISLVFILEPTKIHISIRFALSGISIRFILVMQKDKVYLVLIFNVIVFLVNFFTSTEFKLIHKK